ncbi:MAG: hypothetical protein AAF790_15035, partial [Planctomycetota bacterium]
PPPAPLPPTEPPGKQQRENPVAEADAAEQTPQAAPNPANQETNAEAEARLPDVDVRQEPGDIGQSSDALKSDGPSTIAPAPPPAADMFPQAAVPDSAATPPQQAYAPAPPADADDALMIAQQIGPPAYSARRLAERLQLVEREGGSRATEDAVAAGLAWLAAAQSADGRWDASRWSAGRETRTLGQNRQGAGARADTGVTGLALLALMGAGHTHTEGPYAENIRAGLAFLLATQTADGSLAGDAAPFSQTYCHSMAAFALAEALATTQDGRLAAGVRRAVDHLVDRQDRAGGGWRYKPGAEGDMSQMGWVIMALRSAELAGVDAPPTVWSSIERFVRATRRGQAGGLACYQRTGPVSRTMTAESLYCRQILGWRVAGTAAADEAVSSLVSAVPGSGRANLYFWYYAGLALHHNRGANRTARHAWTHWNAAMTRTLTASQTAAGPDAGSWSPDTVWGGYGGRVYSTALATMCLEVYYRYDASAVARDPWIASRSPAGRFR